jgi:hypothetical protein
LEAQNFEALFKSAHFWKRSLLEALTFVTHSAFSEALTFVSVRFIKDKEALLHFKS